MNIRIHTKNGSRAAVLESAELLVTDTGSALDLLMQIRHDHECDKALIPKACICEEFFDLRTGLAGEILQKFVNYGLKAAIVGDFSGYDSKALRDFIRESNRGNLFFFLPDEGAALDALHGV